MKFRIETIIKWPSDPDTRKAGMVTVTFDPADPQSRLARSNKVKINDWGISNFGAVLPGTTFTASLQLKSHARFGPQYDGPTATPCNMLLARTISVIHDYLAKTHRNAFARIVLERGEALPAMLRGAPDAAALRGALNIPPTFAASLHKAHAKAVPTIDLIIAFPMIPEKVMSILVARRVTTAAIEMNPFSVAQIVGVTRRDCNVLALCDDIALRLPQVPPSNHACRLRMYTERAMHLLATDMNVADGGSHHLNVHHGSTWFPVNVVIARTMTLQMQVGNRRAGGWCFTQSDLAPLFDESTLAEYIAIDRSAYGVPICARKEISDIERDVARCLLAPRRSPHYTALSVLDFFDKIIAAEEAEEADGHLAAAPLVSQLDEYLSTRGMSNTCVMEVLGKYKLLDATQRSACTILARERVLVILGGAGVGKSTTLAVVVKFLNDVARSTPRAVSYTGKAVSRLRTVIGDPRITTRTMHKEVIRCQREGRSQSLVIDEASVIPMWLMRNTLTISGGDDFLVICGDNKQLPSFEPGMLLRDIVESGSIPTLTLSKIYRSGEGSGIATEAPKIFSHGADQLQVADIDVNGFKIRLSPSSLQSSLLSDAVDEMIGLSTATEHRPALEVQMVTNTNNECHSANRLLQRHFNPSSASASTPKLQPPSSTKQGTPSLPWVKGDRVIVIKNIDLDEDSTSDPTDDPTSDPTDDPTSDPTAGLRTGWSAASDRRGLRLYNGTMGVIDTIDTVNETFTVNFDDGIRYEFTMRTPNVLHAWCVTTHRYQGSEVQAVVAMFNQKSLLSCEMVYTAVTRGKQVASLYMPPSNLEYALKQRTYSVRKTGLVKRLGEASGGVVTEEEEEEEEEEREDDASGDPTRASLSPRPAKRKRGVEYQAD